MKDIVIIANFCRDFSENDNGRFMYLSKELSKNNKVEIITSDFFHAKKQYREKLKQEWPFKITFLHEPRYSKNISLKRFYSHGVWGVNVKKYLNKRKKPDVIYCAVPSMTAAKFAADYCRNNDVKFIIDIQDLWPEAFKMVINIPILSNLIFYPLKKLADKIYSSADVIVGVSKSYVSRALEVNLKCKNAIAVFLGTDLSTFDKNVRLNEVKGKNKNDIWLAYCGTLGTSYDIKTVMDALAILKSKYINSIKFIIMGDGPKKEEFEQYAKKQGITANFTGRLPYDKMCGILQACDIVINPIVGNSAASIINKHADYAASGLPVLNTQLSIEYRELIDVYEMGFNCNNGDPNDLANKMDILIQRRDLRIAYGKNARRCAEERFNRKNTYKKIIEVIME